MDIDPPAEALAEAPNLLENIEELLAASSSGQAAALGRGSATETHAVKRANERSSTFRSLSRLDLQQRQQRLMKRQAAALKQGKEGLPTVADTSAQLLALTGEHYTRANLKPKAAAVMEAALEGMFEVLKGGPVPATGNQLVDFICEAKLLAPTTDSRNAWHVELAIQKARLRDLTYASQLLRMGPKNETEEDSFQRALNLGQVYLAQWWESESFLHPSSQASRFWAPRSLANRSSDSEVEAAAKAFQAAIRLRPTSTGAVLRFAQTQGLLGQPEKAQAAAESLVAACEGHPQAQAVHAFILVQMARAARRLTPQAAESLISLLQLSPEDRPALSVLLSLGPRGEVSPGALARACLLHLSSTSWERGGGGAEEGGGEEGMERGGERREEAAAEERRGGGGAPAAEGGSHRGGEQAGGENGGKKKSVSWLGQVYAAAVTWDYFTPIRPFGSSRTPPELSEEAVWTAAAQAIAGAARAAAESPGERAGERGEGPAGNAAREGREEAAWERVGERAGVVDWSALLGTLRRCLPQWGPLFFVHREEGAAGQSAAASPPPSSQGASPEEAALQAAKAAVATLLLGRMPALGEDETLPEAGPLDETLAGTASTSPDGNPSEVLSLSEEAVQLAQSLPEESAAGCRELGVLVRTLQTEREGRDPLLGMPWGWWQVFPQVASRRRALQALKRGVG